jgi:fatty-acyl-CoA synthase
MLRIKSLKPVFRAYSTNYSYLKGETFEGINKTVGNYFATQTKNIPYTNAIRSSHQRILWSYSALKKHVDALACGLLELGLRPGDRLGFIQGNNAEQVVTMMAVSKIGGILVEFKNVKTVKDFNRYMELFRPRLVMLPTNYQKVDYWSMLYDLIPELDKAQQKAPVKSKRFPYCKNFILTDFDIEPRRGTYLYKDAFVYGPFGYYENPLRRAAMHIKPDDAALILLDEEDVNKAKPVVYSHQNLLNSGFILGKMLGIKPGDRVMVPSNQNTIYGSILGNFSTLVHGATLVLPCNVFNAGDVLKYLAQDQCTVIIAQPNEYKELLQHPELGKYTFPTLRVVAVDDFAGDELVHDLESKFKIKVTRIKGLNETAGLLQVNSQMAYNTELKIIRPKDGKILEKDTNGWLKVKGPTVAKGYWNDIGCMNDKIDEDGFLLTNKMGMIDSTGKLIIN